MDWPVPLPLLRPRVTNRKLRQRRPLRARLPSGRAVGRAILRGLGAAVPAFIVLAVIAGLGVAGVAASRWLMTSPRFALRAIEVTGNTRVTEADLLRRAGVAAGQNVFAVAIRATEARLLADPWIAEAEVRRRLPDGLAIRVSERRPAGVVVVDAAGLYLAEQNGHVFKRAVLGAGEGVGLPVVSGVERRLFGDDPELAAALVRRALDVAVAWKLRERPPLGEIHVGKDGLTLYTLDGAVAVALGRPADSAAALKRFDAAWAALPPDERAQVRTIHLDSRTRPDRVTISLADPAAR